MFNNRFFAFSGLLMILVLLASAGAFAQEPATSLDQLKLLLKQGDRITVVDSSGKTIKGQIERIAPDTLDVRTNGEIRSFTDSNLRQITRRKADSALNGTLIGAGIGFGATLPFFLGLAEHDEKGTAVAAACVWGLIGAGIGALTDVAVQGKQTVYVRPKTSASWSIRPIYGDSAFRIQPTGGPAFQLSQTKYGSDTVKGLSLTFRF